MSVSITVQDLRVVFSSISRNEEHIQKPASLTCERAVAPPQIARQIAARMSTEAPATAGMAAIMPDAIVIATMELPTEARTMTAIKKATTTKGSGEASSIGPITWPKPQSCSIQRMTPPQAITSKIMPTGLRERSSKALSSAPE